MRTITTLVLILITHTAFSQNPVADFQVNIEYKCGYAMTEFINNSVNADTFLWDVHGNGYFIEIYEPRGSNIGIDKKWNITLIAKQNGLSDTLSKEVEVFNTKIEFEKSIIDTNLFAPIFVDFSNMSEIRDGDTVSYRWDFGDGIYSNQISPEHTYEIPGTYYITLTGTKSDGCELTYFDYVIAKDTAQKGEFNYIVSGCSSNPCDWNKTHLIESYNFILNQIYENSDTVVLSGIIGQNCCTDKAVTLRKVNDTIFINTWEVGPQCTCWDDFYFEIKLLYFEGDSITISFNNEIVTTTLTNISGRRFYSTEFNLFPNPVKNAINIEFPINIPIDYQYQILDLQGRIIQIGELINQNKIDLKCKENGLFLLHLQSKINKGIYILKFIKI